MKKLILPIFLVITTSLFFSCDKIETPLVAEEPGGVVDPNDTVSAPVVRRILMEEFTGHYCTNCPLAATEMERLVGVYGSQIIPISLHAGNVTFNQPQTGSGKYETDFRTPDGDAYATLFQPFGLPSGMVSRRNSGTAIPYAQWEAEILSIKDDAPIAEITITNVYNSSTKEVSIEIETEWLLDGGSGVDYKIQVGIIEDHIIDWQLDNNVNVPDYEHRHVYRGAVNTTWGEAISTTTQGSKDNKSYSYTLDSGWNPDNCEVVAFIYKDAPDYEIMQANIKHVN
jgi:hypothetical protein